MHVDKNKQLKRAQYLNEASKLIHKAHIGLQWINFLTPCKADLVKLQTALEEAVANIQRVVGDNLYEPYKH